MTQLQVPKEVALQRQLQTMQENQLYNSAFQIYLQLLSTVKYRTLESQSGSTVSSLFTEDNILIQKEHLAELSIECAKVFQTMVKTHKNKET